MTLFTRCKKLKIILIVLDVIIGIVLFLASFGTFSDFTLISSDSNRVLMLYISGCILFIILLVSVLILNCLIKDAEEDLNAIIRLK